MVGNDNNSFTSSGRPSNEQPYTSRISNTSDSFNRNFESPRWSGGAYSIYGGGSYQSDDSFSSQPMVSPFSQYRKEIFINKKKLKTNKPYLSDHF